MITLPYTILYNIGLYDAIISYFALAKYIKKYGTITPYMLNFPCFIGNYSDFMNIHNVDVLYLLWCKYGCLIFIEYYHIFH